MKCKCGKESEQRDFRTFSYHYCTSCKVEVKGTPATQSTEPTLEAPSQKETCAADEYDESLSNGAYML